MRYFWCFGTARRSSRFNPFIHFCRFSPKSAKTEEFFKISTDCLFGLDPQILGNGCATLVHLDVHLMVLQHHGHSADRAFNCSIWGGMSTANLRLIRLVIPWQTIGQTTLDHLNRPVSRSVSHLKAVNACRSLHVEQQAEVMVAHGRIADRSLQVYIDR